GQPACTTLEVYVTAYDAAGNSVESEHDYKHWADTEAPVIVEVTQSPVSPVQGQDVIVTALVTDNVGVTEVTLTYGSITVDMIYDELDGLWMAVIPGQPAGTTLTVYVTAFDEARNSDQTEPHEKLWRKSVETWMSDSSDQRITITGFKIVFTPDWPCGMRYKLSATNPGGFYLNLLYHVFTGSETITYELPPEFETNGATQIHAYLWTDFDEDGEIDYWIELADITERITMDPTTCEIIVSEVDVCDDVLITIHTPFALKGEIYTFEEAEAFAGNVYEFLMDVDGTASDASLEAHIELNQVWGSAIHGLVLDQTSEGTPIAGITFSLFNSRGSCIGSHTTDDSGYYIFDDLAVGEYELHIEIPLSLFLDGSEQSGIMLCMIMQINLQCCDLIEVNVYVMENSAASEGPDGLSAMVSPTNLVSYSGPTNHPREHSRSFESPVAGDYSYDSEPLVTISFAGVLILFAWFGPLLSLVYGFNLRKRRVARSKSDESLGHFKSSLYDAEEARAESI
ncbi:MAG: SdrD B-like domain-containing protein, partial [Promethearchaeota archaeon]